MTWTISTNWPRKGSCQIHMMIGCNTSISIYLSVLQLNNECFWKRTKLEEVTTMPWIMGGENFCCLIFLFFNRAVLQNGHYTRSCGIADHRSGSYVIPGEFNLIFSLELTIIYLPTNFFVISPLLISIKSATKM